MLFLKKGGRIGWGERDVIRMERVIGADAAVSRSATYQPSIIKLASDVGCRLSPKLSVRLSAANALCNTLRIRRDFEDAKIGWLPKKTRRRLFKHQRVALDYMSHGNEFLLADAPGVGKTPVAILWTAWKMEEETTRRLVVPYQPPRRLVICPNNAKHQWRREIKRWIGEDARIIPGKQDVRRSTKVTKLQNRLARNLNGWIIGHWESLVTAGDGYREHPWDAVILDEGHRIGNRDAVKTGVVQHLDARYKLVLTGHPYANSPEELYPILQFLRPDEYTSFWRFFHMHVQARPKPFGGYEIEGLRHPKLLRWELAPFTIRRTKKQVFPSLPAITRTARSVELTNRGLSEYEKLKHQFFVELRAAEPSATKIIPIPSILARTTRIRQYLIDPGLLGARERSVKYPAVAELLDEISAPAVIFTSFRQAAIRLMTFLKGRETALIAGKMTDRDKERNKRIFLAGKLQALVVVGSAGGESLNLGKHGYVIFLDLPWTAKDLEQWEGRVDRPEEGTGKMVPTTAYRVIVADSYEERQEQMLEDKHAMFQRGFSRARLEALFA